MSSLNITSHKTNQLFTFHDQVWSFSARVYSWKDFSTCSLGSRHNSWHNIKILLAFFLRPLLPTILFSIFETCPGSWFNIPENLKSFLSLGTKIVKKGASILTGLAEIINKAIKGLNFLHLWGERRALRLRLVTTGWQFNTYAYWVNAQ